MTTHTPGPWMAHARHVIAVDCGTLEVDGYHDHCVVDCCDGRTPNEAKANARLISAAPELLEAAQMILRGFAMMEAVDPRGWKRWKDSCGDAAIEFKHGLCDATAAVAKAEGRTP